MQEHRGKKRRYLLGQGKILGHLRIGVTGGNDGGLKQEVLQVPTQSQFAQEDQYVEHDEGQRRDGETRGRNVIPQRDHGLAIDGAMGKGVGESWL